MTHQTEILAAARSSIYQFLSLAFAYPDAALLAQLKSLFHHLEDCLKVQEDQECHAEAEAIGTVLETLTLEDWNTSYLRCFGHTISKECPPYEAEYGQTHIFRKSQNLADIAGFYRAFGVDIAPDLNDRCDHISVELEFMQLLSLKEAYALGQNHTEDKRILCRDAQVKFLGQHLGCWAKGFARRLGEKTSGGLLGAIAKLLEAFVASEMRRLDVQMGTEIPPLLEESLEETASGCQDCTLASPPTAFEQGGLP